MSRNATESETADGAIVQAAAGDPRTAAIWSALGQYIGFALQFVTSVIISRFFLTPAEVGLFSIALAAAMMITILQDFGMTRYLAGHAALTREETRRCASLSLLLSLAIAGIIVLLAWPIAQFYKEPRLTAILAMIAVSLLLSPWSSLPAALLTRDLDFRGLFLVNAGSGLANSASALIFAANGFSDESLAMAMIVQALARAGIAQWLRPFAIPLRPRLAGSRAALRFGGGSTVLAISGALGVRTPDLIVGRILGMHVVGLYSRGWSLAASLHMLVVGSIGAVFYPAFARLRDEGRPLGPQYERVVAGYGAVVWPAMALLAALATPVVLLLYGPVWQEAGRLLVWMALAEICFITVPLHMDLPILLGRMRQLIRYNLADTAASIGTLIVGASIGLEAAAISRLAYGLIWIAIYARFMHGLLGFRWSYLAGVYARSAVVALATAAPTLAIYRWWRTPETLGWDGFLIAVAAGLAAWALALLATRHPGLDDLLGMVRHAFGQMFGRRAARTA
ncbi:MAG: oligosaccharide flippase family protein [Novosphingobium sp.]